MAVPLCEVPKRVFRRVLDDYVINESGCYISKVRPYSNGYVTLAWGENGITHRTSLHRLSYWVSHGIDPGQLQIDHTCHVPSECLETRRCPHRRCFNPEHLTMATPRENTLRSNSLTAFHASKPNCPRCGEQWSVRAGGYGRECRPCRRAAGRLYARTVIKQRASVGIKKRRLARSEVRNERVPLSVRQRILSDRLQGVSYGRIASWLMDAQILTLSGNQRWYPATVRAVVVALEMNGQWKPSERYC